MDETELNLIILNETKITTTPPHPKYQNNNISNTQMKMSKFSFGKIKHKKSDR